MGLLNMIGQSGLGLKGLKPSIFGVNPVPPNSLHDTYSTTGAPDVKWRTISGTGMKPLPSNLDETKTKDLFNPKYTYSQHPPQ